MPAPTTLPLDQTEGQRFDRKSLRKVTGSRADLEEFAQECVGFANGGGGRFHLGVEDNETHPPANQRVGQDVLDRIRKRIGELTVNVQVLPELHRDENGGEFIQLEVPRSQSVASTSDGRYFLRVGDTCRPIVGDDVMRLADERPSRPWEAMTSLGIAVTDADAAQVARLTSGLRASDRVKPAVKEKSDAELLVHCGLAASGQLTNLGVLLIGTTRSRTLLGTAPIVQALRYDEHGTKVGKLAWDDNTRSPLELIDVIWEEVPDFRESYELPDGMFRTQVPAFDKDVVRELLVNALVHRPYTQRGDIFLNLHPDRMEIVNPGRLPLGVTPQNILHTSRRRNEALARVFHDLKLMEREGTGFDLIYDRLLSSGRAVPTASEGVDSVHVVVPRRVIQAGAIRLVAKAQERFALSQRERITLALLAQSEALSAVALGKKLELEDAEALRPWLGRLLEWRLVEQTGRTKATRYHVPPALLRDAGFDQVTTLTRVQPHRLKALILEDLERFPNSSRVDLHRRIGPEIHVRTVMRALDALVKEGLVVATGVRRWRKYTLGNSHDQRS